MPVFRLMTEDAMWFKNLQVYRFTRPFELSLEELETQLESMTFSPCGSQEQAKFGWISPQGKQVRTVTAHNKATGHVEPDWSTDQLNGTGAYANLSDSQMIAWNRAPGTYGAGAVSGAAGGQTSMTGGIPNEDEDKGRVTRA